MTVIPHRLNYDSSAPAPHSFENHLPPIVENPQEKEAAEAYAGQIFAGYLFTISGSNTPEPEPSPLQQPKKSRDTSEGINSTNILEGKRASKPTPKNTIQKTAQSLGLTTAEYRQYLKNQIPNKEGSYYFIVADHKA
jgi:hypothetical protein